MKIISKNKKAYFDYEILEKFIAGIILEGNEVKAIRESKVNLGGSYIVPHKEEIFIEGMHISPYQPANQTDYNPTRKRKILLNKKEIVKLKTAFEGKGKSIIPLAVGLEGKYIKLEIAIAQGKKKYDKRETIKKRDLDREMKYRGKS